MEWSDRLASRYAYPSPGLQISLAWEVIWLFSYFTLSVSDWVGGPLCPTSSNYDLGDLDMDFV